jgi:hypothetical protein
MFNGFLPRVAHSAQPWALWRNPVGILHANTKPKSSTPPPGWATGFSFPATNGTDISGTQIGPDFLFIEPSADHPPCNATIILQVDESERTWTVHWPKGISSRSNRVEIAKPAQNGKLPRVKGPRPVPGHGFILGSLYEPLAISCFKGAF